MKHLLLSMLLISSAAWSGETFDLSNRLGVGGSGGWAFPIMQNSFDQNADDDLAWGLHLRYHTTASDSLLLNYTHMDFENSDINAQVMDLMYLARLNEYDKMTPILGIGAGVADLANISPYRDSLKFAAKARAGLEYALSDDFFAQAFVDYQYIGKMPNNSENDETDRYSLPGKEIHALVPQVALTLFFGPDKEMKDKDSAAAPATAAVAVPVTTPTTTLDPTQTDSDLDGIVDAKDRCPGSAPRSQVTVNGCLVGEAPRVP